MTIQERRCEHTNGGVDAVYVYCVHKDHARKDGSGDPRTLLFRIHHGYGETQPISPYEYAKAFAVAVLHDSQTYGEHLLDIVLFSSRPWKNQNS